MLFTSSGRDFTTIGSSVAWLDLTDQIAAQGRAIRKKALPFAGSIGMMTRLVVLEPGTGAQLPSVKLARVSRWPAIVGQETSSVLADNCTASRMGANLYAIPPVPFAEVF